MISNNEKSMRSFVSVRICELRFGTARSEIVWRREVETNKVSWRQFKFSGTLWCFLANVIAIVRGSGLVIIAVTVPN